MGGSPSPSGPVPLQEPSPAPNQRAAYWELNRRLGAKIFFSSHPPDWHSVSRCYEIRRASGVSRAKEFVRPEEVMAAGEKHRRGKMALRVLHSLPSQHEMFFYRGRPMFQKRNLVSPSPISMPSSNLLRTIHAVTSTAAMR